MQRYALLILTTIRNRGDAYQYDTTASNGVEKFMESPNQHDLWKASVNFSAP